MNSLKLCFAYFLLVLQICSIVGQNSTKSCLTFVIDNTGSMFSEINEVKNKIGEVFDTAFTTEDSQIGKIVLVTFNDPDAQLRTITSDLNELQQTLENIKVYGGADCPEYALSGVKLGLENSLPYSTVFVFTDAAATDYIMFEEVKTLALQKNIRIFFILTGHCRSTTDENYQIYHKLAKATSGNVFEVFKENIRDIMPLVIQNIRNRRHALVPQIYKKKFNFTVYNEDVAVYITIRGRDSKIQIYDPQGRNVETQLILRQDPILGVKVVTNQLGIYRGEVTGWSQIHLQVLGNNTLNFVDEDSSF